MTEGTRKDKFDYLVEKGAYVAAALIGLFFMYLMYTLMGWLVITLLLVSFVFLMIFKIGFLWFLK